MKTMRKNRIWKRKPEEVENGGKITCIFQFSLSGGVYHIILCTYYGNLVNEDDEKEQDMEMETRVEKGGRITRTIVTGLLRGPTCPTLYKARQIHPPTVLQGNTRRR